MSIHTLALWFHEPTEKTENGLDELIVSADGKWIGWAYKKADAKIMADAPALLDALEKAEKMLCAQEDALREMGCDEINAEPAILLARALIAKHRGGV